MLIEGNIPTDLAQHSPSNQRTSRTTNVLEVIIAYEIVGTVSLHYICCVKSTTESEPNEPKISLLSIVIRWRCSLICIWACSNVAAFSNAEFSSQCKRWSYILWSILRIQIERVIFEIITWLDMLLRESRSMNVEYRRLEYRSRTPSKLLQWKFRHNVTVPVSPCRASKPTQAASSATDCNYSLRKIRI